jgi:Leucine-rich repeat (LRR) protein
MLNVYVLCDRGRATFWNCYLPTFPKEITALDLSYGFSGLELFISLEEDPTITLGSNFFGNVSHITYLDFSSNHVYMTGNPFELITNLNTLIWNSVSVHSDSPTYFELSLFKPLSLLKDLEISPYSGIWQYLESYSLETLGVHGKQYLVSCNATRNFLPRGLRRLILNTYPLANCTMSIFSKQEHLKELSLEDTCVKPVMDSTVNVEVLDLSSNSLKEFPQTCSNEASSLFPNLLSLHISANDIDNLPKQVCLPRLQYLILRRNKILYNPVTRICNKPFAAFTNLTHLDLQYNSIMVISPGTFAGLAQLTTLELSLNDIISISDGSFTGLVQLKNLSLTYSQISVIPAGTFAGLFHLELLYLSYNRISVIADGAFRDLHSLNLTRNKIVVVSEDALKQIRDGQALIHIDFSYQMNIVCNCSMQWFHAWFVNRREVFVGNDDLYNCSNMNGITMRRWVVSHQECPFHDPQHFVLLFVVSLILLTGLLTGLIILKRALKIRDALAEPLGSTSECGTRDAS